MKFNVGTARAKYLKSTAWHKWFAWAPVRTSPLEESTTTYAWLEVVLRKNVHDGRTRCQYSGARIADYKGRNWIYRPYTPENVVICTLGVELVELAEEDKEKWDDGH